MSTTLAVLQPSYMPWLGYFDQMIKSDVFVYYDDVQFDKHGWRNRNRIKMKDGVHWLTVPVQHSGLSGQLVKDIKIDQSLSWQKKHMASLSQSYAKSDHLDFFLPEIYEIFMKSWVYLIDLNMALMSKFLCVLGINTKCYLSSELAVYGGQTERLVELCKKTGATRYLTGNAAKKYLDADLFYNHKIQVQWHDYHHPVYAQLHGEFIPYLSVVDLLLNCGEESRRVLSV